MTAAITLKIQTGNSVSTLEDLVEKLNRMHLRAACHTALLDHLSVAVIQADVTALVPLVSDLREMGITDIDRYLSARPGLMHRAKQSVELLGINASARSLIAACDGGHISQSILGPLDAIPDAALRTVAALYHGHTGWSQTTKLKASDGGLLDILVTASFCNVTEKMQTMLVTITDVTEQVRFDSVLKTVEEKSSQLDKLTALAHLSASVVHEVRQPLSVVATDLVTLRKRLSRIAPVDGSINRLLSRAEASTRRADDIIVRMRELASGAPPRRSACDLNRVAAEAIGAVELERARRSVRLSADYGVLPLIQADEGGLQQLLINILMNALEATDGSSREKVVIVRTKADRSFVFIEVEDTGCGLPRENAGLIFHSFVTTKRSGTGMGLPISRAIARSHGGDIDLMKPSSEGATFVIRLPLHPPGWPLANGVVPAFA